MGAIKALPKLERISIDSTTRTRVLFERFAEHHEPYSMQFNIKDRIVKDPRGRIWHLKGCVVSNRIEKEMGLHITATDLKNESGPAFDDFLKYISVELRDVTSEEIGVRTYVEFSTAYPLGAQDETDLASRKSGSVSHFGIKGIVAIPAAPEKSARLTPEEKSVASDVHAYYSAEMIDRNVVREIEIAKRRQTTALEVEFGEDDVFNDNDTLRFKLIEMWLDLREAQLAYHVQLTGVYLSESQAVDWLNEKYEGGSEEAKRLLVRCMMAGVELPEFEGDGHRYPPELYEAADYPVADGGYVTTRSSRGLKGF